MDTFVDLVERLLKFPILWPVVIPLLIVVVIVGGLLFFIGFATFYVIAFAVRFPFWLFGYWWCAICHRKFSVKTKKMSARSKYDVSSFGYGFYHYEKVCSQCFEKHDGKMPR
jgi:hypothetical protein